MTEKQRKVIEQPSRLKYWEYEILEDWVIETYKDTGRKYVIHGCSNDEATPEQFGLIKSNGNCSACGAEPAKELKAVFSLIRLQV